MLEAIKMELDGSGTLLEDFPEVCRPIQALEGIANRCSGQLYNGQRTHVGWTAKDIVLPTVKPAGWPDDERLREFVGPDGYAHVGPAIAPSSAKCPLATGS